VTKETFEMVSLHRSQIRWLRHVSCTSLVEEKKRSGHKTVWRCRRNYSTASHSTRHTTTRTLLSKISLSFLGRHPLGSLRTMFLENLTPSVTAWIRSLLCSTLTMTITTSLYAEWKVSALYIILWKERERAGGKYITVQQYDSDNTSGT